MIQYESALYGHFYYGLLLEIHAFLIMHKILCYTVSKETI